MADDKLREKLADYVEDAHAMEQNDLKMIDSMISTTDDPQVKQTANKPFCASHAGEAAAAHTRTTRTPHQGPRRPPPTKRPRTKSR